ncbi:unnamed protein product [Cuscuta campestris]|uniref:Uncharacterized protein n=1 Tax=Cuscuta campestris TaxID=132261 RepID=A0A484KCT3_9ASTE|nr:unnamed protein product [Cuscuta campestris]
MDLDVFGLPLLEHHNNVKVAVYYIPFAASFTYCIPKMVDRAQAVQDAKNMPRSTLGYIDDKAQADFKWGDEKC